MRATVTGGGPTYKYGYGRTDRNGLPIIQTETRTSGTSVANAYLAHDPAGLPVTIQTSTGTVALYVYDGRAASLLHDRSGLSATTCFSSVRPGRRLGEMGPKPARTRRL
jgi:hypothetical protein